MPTPRGRESHGRECRPPVAQPRPLALPPMGLAPPFRHSRPPTGNYSGEGVKTRSTLGAARETRDSTIPRRPYATMYMYTAPRMTGERSAGTRFYVSPRVEGDRHGFRPGAIFTWVLFVSMACACKAVRPALSRSHVIKAHGGALRAGTSARSCDADRLPTRPSADYITAVRAERSSSI